MKVLSLFTGIGAFEKALKNMGIPFELVGFSEIDKYAPKSYCAIHGVDESLNLGDITKIDESKLPNDIDLITYGFPCQDISIAGKGKGLFNEDGSKTRSGLFFDALRIIEATKPKIAIAENVKNLTSKRFKEQFAIVLESLEEAGYNNYYKILNAKDFGVPQNRERVFIVSIRKDLDDGVFKFPEGFPLTLRLKDMLEEKVADNFYLSDSLISKVVKFENNKSSESNCIQAADLNHYGNDQMNRVYSPEGISPTVLTKTGGGRETKVLEEPKIMRVDIPQTVRVRKYEVDCEALCECLRKHKASVKLSNKEIAKALDVPLTNVEHWFRQDKYFTIPEPEIWVKLKNLLKIRINEFDEAIMTFEEKEGVYEKAERHYSSEGLMPTLLSTTAGNEKILVRVANKTGYQEAGLGDSINFEQPSSTTRRGRVGYGVAQTLNTGSHQGVVVNE